ncbi:MAG: hypothetical protein RLZZ455_1233 [Candidatus Parcubacteria bacterium]|jgi:glycosyltransferase involved in cell wall biosynthesis
MKKQRITVSVGTAAYNEGANIEMMLRSVLKQTQKNIVIKEILIASDGSTDDTVSKVKSLRSKQIKVIAGSSRKGQPYRLNQILQKFQSQYLVIMDADSVLGRPDAIEKLIGCFVKDSRIGLVAGNTIPIHGETFLEKSANNYIYARQKLQKNYNFGKKALVAHAYLAFSKRLAGEMSLPKGIMNSDAYSYFEAKRRGYKVGYSHASVVYYRSPSTVREYVRQKTRQIAGGRQLDEYFGNKTVKEGFSPPLWVMRELLKEQLRLSPIGYLLVKVLFTFSSLRGKRFKRKMDTRWEIAGSTKGIIII